MKEMRDLVSVVKPVIEGMGYIYWGMEFLGQGHHTKLCVLIDSEDGITLSDCSAVSDQLSSVLDVEDPIPQAYTLEISSPGLERPLFEVEHYQAYLGNKIRVNTHQAVEGRKRFSGLLEAVEDEAVVLNIDRDTVRIPFHLIRRSHLIYEGMH